MKKIIVIGAVLLALVVVAGAASLAYAQAQSPGQGVSGPGMMGWGMGQRGRMMGAGRQGGYGPVHTYFVNALAEALGMTTDELQGRLDDGETPWQIASSTGLSDDQVSELLVQVHNTALDNAVADGAITQEQADWMKDHMQGMWSNGAGPGNCPMHGGRWNRP